MTKISAKPDLPVVRRARRAGTARSPQAGQAGIQTPVKIEPDAQEFIEKADLANQVSSALNLLGAHFSCVQSVTLDYFEDADDAPPSPHLVLAIGCDMDPRSFRDASVEFLFAVRASGCGRLYVFLSVIRD